MDECAFDMLTLDQVCTLFSFIMTSIYHYAYLYVIVATFVTVFCSMWMHIAF